MIFIGMFTKKISVQSFLHAICQVNIQKHYVTAVGAFGLQSLVGALWLVFDANTTE